MATHSVRSIEQAKTSSPSAAFCEHSERHTGFEVSERHTGFQVSERHTGFEHSERRAGFQESASADKPRLDTAKLAYAQTPNQRKRCYESQSRGQAAYLGARSSNPNAPHTFEGRDLQQQAEQAQRADAHLCEAIRIVAHLAKLFTEVLRNA